MLSLRDRSRRVLLAALAPFLLLLTGCVGCGGPDLIDRLSRREWGCWGTAVVVLDLLALVDLLGGDTYGTTGKLLWTLLIVFFPIGGVILYFLLGN